MLDIQAGRSDVELMRKYGLSAKGMAMLRRQVEEIFKERQAGPKKEVVRVNAKALLQDVRDGMDDDILMQRHKLTNRQLQIAFRKIIDAGYTTALELSQRLCITKSQVSEAFAEADAAVDELD